MRSACCETMTVRLPVANPAIASSTSLRIWPPYAGAAVNGSRTTLVSPSIAQRDSVSTRDAFSMRAESAGQSSIGCGRPRGISP